jgi:anthranilate synthase/aminodeoxychorismate synthase-like glutamine amidotransferase
VYFTPHEEFQSRGRLQDKKGNPMILMIDNYDSFTYNLVQYLKEFGQDVEVIRNDTISANDLEKMTPSAVVISPGPGRPEDSKLSLSAIRYFSGKTPVLGVCLGHQAIGVAFGATVGRAHRLMHGKTSSVTCDGRSIFKGMNRPFQAMRYHSLVVEKENLPDCLAVSATADDGEIMGLRHKTHPTEGIQFHPESIMTPLGKRILRNFLHLVPGAETTNHHQ